MMIVDTGDGWEDEVLPQLREELSQMLDDDSAVPRGATGKVDLPRLRALLEDR